MKPTRSWHGYALSGQSNARGNNDGDVSDLGFRFPVSQLHAYDAGAYAPGTGRDPVWWTSGAISAPRCDVGVGLATRFQRDHPEMGFRFAKDAVGGSLISQWIATFGPRHVATMQATGWTFHGGLVWIQGESDAALEGEATAYFARLTSLFQVYRAAFPDLKVCVVNCPSDYVAPYINEVRAAQEEYARSDGRCAFVDVAEFEGQQHDGVHWPEEVLFALGSRCYDALRLL